MIAPLIDIQEISKSYRGVKALNNVSLQIAPGEIHGLCGENGAGKSTLIKILSGVVTPDQGRILIRNRPMEFGSVANSEDQGVAVMHQESTSFPDLNAIENLFVGREHTSYFHLILNRRKMRQEAEAIFSQLGESFDLQRQIRELSLAQRQMVSIARAISKDCRFLIMDEPTASLSTRETDVLFGIMRQLRERGVSIFYVTHRLEEIFRLTDRVTILRDGLVVSTRSTSNSNQDQLIQGMIGRSISPQKAIRHSPVKQSKRVRLEVNGLTRSGVFHDINLQVRENEILGISGLVGAGRSEVARAIFGIDDYDSGAVMVDGRKIRAGRVRDAMQAGIALVPEDRQHEGLVLPMAIGANISLAVLPKLTRFYFTRKRQELDLIKRQVDALQVKMDRQNHAADTLSGGNQQKLVLAKWLANHPKILILDEPTRGVDVSAKTQIYTIIRELAERGISVVVISSDLPEILTLSDRILVMREGEVSGEYAREEATQKRLLELALPKFKPTDNIHEPGYIPAAE